MKLKWRLVIYFIFIAAFTLVIANFAIQRTAAGYFKEDILNHLQSVAWLKKERITDFLRDREDLFRSISGRSQLRLILKDNLGNPSFDFQNAILPLIGSTVRAVKKIKSITVYRMDGTILSTTEPSLTGKNIASEPFFIAGATRYEIGYPFVNLQGELCLRALGPILHDGETLGVMGLVLDGEFLNFLNTQYIGLGDTGESQTATRNSTGEAIFITHMRFDPSGGMRRKVSGLPGLSPILRALNQEEGFFDSAIDYRHIPVLAVTAYIPEVKWGIVVKMDQAEAFSPITALNKVFIALFFLALILVFLLSLLLARTITLPLEKLRQLTSRISEGDYAQKVEIDTDREISALCSAFNLMACNLVTAKESLDKKIAQLDIEIVERTHAEENLQKAYLEVENRVKLRTDELNIAKRLAEQANEAKSTFLNHISHELRNPLNSLLILAKSLAENKKGNLTPEQQSQAHIIFEGGHSLLSLINEILDLAKIEAGKFEIHPADFPLAELIGSLERILTPAAKEKSLFFRIDQQPQGLPEVLHADQKRLSQIIKNLAFNAIKFTERGGVTLKIFTRVGEGTGSMSLGFMVIDTGIGISADRQDFLFKAFSQEDSSITRKYGGTGLGLAISKELARLMGGFIEFHSEKNQGSQFSFFIPISPASTPVQPTIPPISPAVAKTREIPSTPAAVPIPTPYPANFLRGSAILLLEEDGKRAFQMAHLLKKAGAVVYPFKNLDQLLDDPEKIKISIFFIFSEKWLVHDFFDTLKSILTLNATLIPILHRRAEGGLPSFPPELEPRAILGPHLGPNTLAHLHAILSPSPMGSGKAMKNPLAGRRILVVDDDKKNLFAMSTVLGDWGLVVTTAENGLLAIEELHRPPPPDALLMDIMMPVMDGYSAMQEIRAMAEFSGLPIVALTAKANIGERQICLEKGATEYLPKPVDMDHLHQLLCRLLDPSVNSTTQPPKN